RTFGGMNMLRQLQYFNLTRRVFTRLVKDITEDELDVQPEIMNNTLRWHIGHCIVIPEHYMFHYPEQSTHITSYYYDLFAADTKPADWTVEPPSYEELLNEVEKQTERINQIDEAEFNALLKEKLPFGRFETYADLFGFMIHHEAEHIGQMKIMRKMIAHEKELKQS